MLQRLIEHISGPVSDYVARKKDEWKLELFKEPQQRWHFLLLLVFSVAAIYWGVSDYPADPSPGETMLMVIGVCGGTAGLLTSVAELLPKSQTQLAGILRLWAALSAVVIIAVMALQLLSPNLL